LGWHASSVISHQLFETFTRYVESNIMQNPGAYGMSQGHDFVCIALFRAWLQVFCYHRPRFERVRVLAPIYNTVNVALCVYMHLFEYTCMYTHAYGCNWRKQSILWTFKVVYSLSTLLISTIHRALCRILHVAPATLLGHHRLLFRVLSSAINMITGSSSIRACNSRKESDSKLHAKQELSVLRVRILEKRHSDSVQAYCNLEATPWLLDYEGKKLWDFKFFFETMRAHWLMIAFITTRLVTAVCTLAWGSM